MDETIRRRKIQIKYNKAHNIIPKTIYKSQDDIKNTTIIANNNIDKIIKVQDQIDLYDFDSIESNDMIKKIERKMLNYAKELRFEEAALLRNQIDKIKLQKEGVNNE